MAVSRAGGSQSAVTYFGEPSQSERVAGFPDIAGSIPKGHLARHPRAANIIATAEKALVHVPFAQDIDRKLKVQDKEQREAFHDLANVVVEISNHPARVQENSERFFPVYYDFFEKSNMWLNYKSMKLARQWYDQAVASGAVNLKYHKE